MIPPTHHVTPLTNDRVRFTPLQMDNIHTHFHWNNDEELNRFDSEEPFEKEAFGTFKARFEQLCEEASSAYRHFEIHDREADTLIGVAYVTHIHEYNENALVGITIGEQDYRGHGYGRASLRLLLRYCFEELGLHRVRAETFEYNTTWGDLLEDMGFVQEGTAREYLYREGQYWDKELYSLLEGEYREQVVNNAEASSAEATM